MYAALWSLFPGPLWVRILCALAIVALILFALVLWVFPWVNSFISVPEVTVQQ